jgi:hypothetical protein
VVSSKAGRGDIMAVDWFADSRRCTGTVAREMRGSQAKILPVRSLEPDLAECRDQRIGTLIVVLAYSAVCVLIVSGMTALLPY